MIIKSLYTHLFCRNDNCYIYNSETNFFAVIPQELYMKVFDEDFCSLNKDIMKFLLDNKLVLEEKDKYTYFKEQKLRFGASSFDKTRLELVIVPTTACNFSCPYCFEEKKTNVTMSDAIIDSLLEFVKSHKNIEIIDLTWYGGEPLLAFKQICKIYSKLKAEIPVAIGRHSLITNGYLINDEVLSFFNNTHLTDIQITLDGNKNHHNSLRFLKSKKETFDVILDNIKKCSQTLSNVDINVRVNINKENKNDYVEIRELLKQQMHLSNVSVYPGFIREETSNGHSFCFNSIDRKSACDFYEENVKKGCPPLKTSVVHKGCMINKLNSYIIGPEGEIYKCWNDVSNTAKVIGNIQEECLENSTLFARYMTDLSPFSNPECQDCMVFPICSGECGWYRYKNLYEKGKFDTCSSFKNIKFLEDCLVESYKNKRV